MYHNNLVNQLRPSLEKPFPADCWPTNEDKLFKILLNSWNEFQVDLLIRLVNGIPLRCVEVIENNGWSIKY